MADRLSKYKQKRNFDKTPEPEAEDIRAAKGGKAGEATESGKAEGLDKAVEPDKAERTSGNAQFDKAAELTGYAEYAESESKLRFVIQHHIARNDHFDLRLEWDGNLLSWAVPKGPSYNARDKRLAIQVEDHPLEYRNFEGIIPKGEYGGGVVMLWDEGFWQPYGNVEDGLQEGSLKFSLQGARLKGSWALVRLKAKAGDKGNNWLLIKEKDEHAKASDGISEFTSSVRTGRTMQEIEEGRDEKLVKNPFSSTDVQLTKLVNTVPEGNDWLYEMKYDGYRIVAFIEGSSVRLQSRNGNDYTKRFQSIAVALIDWGKERSMVLDGEMVVVDESGKTDFQALQSYMKNPAAQSLTYIIFDLLALDGKDLRGDRLIERKEKLEALMKDTSKNLVYSRHVRDNGQESFEAACSLGMEGIVGKRADSVYSGTRNGDWIKLKCDKRQEFVIGGYTLSDKKSSGVSSILLGVYEGNEGKQSEISNEGDKDGYAGDKLTYVGRAGSGFGKSVVKDLEPRLNALKRAASPFKTAPKARKNEEITWLEPNLVAEIKFAELTEDGLLRQASFKGLRTDKDPRNIRREKAEEPESGDKGGTQGLLYEGKGQLSDLPMAEEGGREKKEHPDNPNNPDNLGNTDNPSNPDNPDKRDSRENRPPGSLASETAKPLKKAGNNLVIEGIKISSPDKLLFDDPKISKMDVIRYYQQVSERMLPYVSHRLLSIVRCPKGVSQTCFYKKHPGTGNRGSIGEGGSSRGSVGEVGSSGGSIGEGKSSKGSSKGNDKGIVACPVSGKDGEMEDYFYIENITGLIYEAQMGTLEFHIWASRVEELEKPDMMVFDLDPDEGMDLSRVRQGVRDIKSILAELSLVSYLKTSGGKGYHVVVPFQPVVSWDVFYDFAKGLAEVMEQKWPDRYTSNIRKSKRTEKIFIDWIRNGRGATSIAPYSLRARRGAKVSMPISWDELDTVAPDGIDMTEALRRIEKEDPWADFFRTSQMLK